MNVRDDVVRRAARAPLRTLRTTDLAGSYAHPKKEIRELARRGLLHRLARGIYCAVPPEADPDRWRPTMEAATAAVATALYGDRVPVLTGLSAARVHHAVPRAVGEGRVAVPRYRRPAALADRDAVVHFVQRAVDSLDAVLVPTDLGAALATSAEQTVLDLARSDPRAEDVDVQEAIAALWPQCDPDALGEIAGRQRMRATLDRVSAGR